MKSQIGDWAAAFFLLAVVGLLVKPGSPAPAAITAFGTALTSLIGTATGAPSNGATQ